VHAHVKPYPVNKEGVKQRKEKGRKRQKKAGGGLEQSTTAEMKEFHK